MALNPLCSGLTTGNISLVLCLSISHLCLNILMKTLSPLPKFWLLLVFSLAWLTTLGNLCSIEATPLTTPLCRIVVRCVHTPTIPRNQDILTQSYPNSHQGNHGNNSPGKFANAIVSTIITLTLTNLNPISIHTLHLILMPTLSPTALCLHPNVIWTRLHAISVITQAIMPTTVMLPLSTQTTSNPTPTTIV